RRPMPGVEERPPAGEVAAHCFDGRTPDRDDALLVALPERADDPRLEVHVGLAEADRLADAQAGAVEKLNEGPVAMGARGRSRRRLDQSFGLGGRERSRQPAMTAREVELGRRV